MLKRTQDSKAKRQNPVSTKQIQRQYERELRQVGREVGKIVNTVTPLAPGAALKVTTLLTRYSELLRPWAVATGARMVEKVEQQDRRAWRSATKELGLGIRQQLQASEPVGLAVRNKLAEQVHYITSIPLDAAKRVQELTIKGMSDSRRSKDIAREIMRSGEVSQSRATLIARTEVGRTSTALTQARSLSIGSDAYIWRTVGDGDVRHSHALMEGKVVKWNDPPTLDGMTGHAGALPNCRCYPEPIIPQLTKE